MKILFYDKFFESFIELPKGIQKKANSFIKKFRENSKSAAIHLEPISTFKDQSLRTARIDQTYRAIIKAPKSGDTYYLLWIDHHDKAYAWAQNKVIQWNELTQTIQVFTAPEEIKLSPPSTSNTNNQQGLFAEFKEKDLLKIGVPEVLLPSVQGIASLDELESLEKFIPAEVFENLFYLADGANIGTLIVEVEEGTISSDNEDEQLASINNQRSFIELTDDTLFNEILSGSLQKWKYYLHPSQRKLVDKDFSGAVKVTGGAGTGKTVAALHRLKYLYHKTQGTQPLLFTTYTKTLTENLKELVKGFELNTAKITIQNIDSLAFELARQYGLLDAQAKVFGLNAVKTPEQIWENILEVELITYDNDFLLKEYEEVVLYHNVSTLNQYFKTPRTGRGKPLSRRQRKEVWDSIELYRQAKNKLGYCHKEEVINQVTDYLETNQHSPYAHVLVDELQDFSNVELRLVRALVAEKTNDLFVVGDPLQKIYDRKINFSKVGINIRGKRSRRLRINYRTTEEIKKLAVSVIKDCSYDNFDGEEEQKNGYVSLFHGNPPTYTTFKTKKDEIAYVLAQINELVSVDKHSNQPYQYNDIVIGARTKNGIKDFKTALHQAKIPYVELSGGRKSGNTEGVNLVTFHSIKGLEFKQVFLVDINQRNYPKYPTNFGGYTDDEKTRYIQNERSLLYVAISRAIERVEITGMGNKSDWIAINS